MYLALKVIVFERIKIYFALYFSTNTFVSNFRVVKKCFKVLDLTLQKMKDKINIPPVIHLGNFEGN